MIMIEGGMIMCEMIGIEDMMIILGMDIVIDEMRGWSGMKGIGERFLEVVSVLGIEEI